MISVISIHLFLTLQVSQYQIVAAIWWFFAQFGLSHCVTSLFMATFKCNAAAIQTIMQSFAYPQSIHWSERLDVVAQSPTQQFEVEDDLSREAVL